MLKKNICNNKKIKTSILSKYNCLISGTLFFLLSACNNNSGLNIFNKENAKNSMLINIPSGPVCDPFNPNMIAQNYIRSGKYNEAVKILLSYKDSLLRSEYNVNIENQLLDVYSNLGNLYKTIGENNSALDYYNKSISIAKKMGNDKTVLSNLNDLSVIYSSLGDQDKAISLLKEADSILKKLESSGNDVTYFSYFININIASFYIEKKDFISAKPYFSKVENIVKNNSSFGNYEKASVLTGEADFFIADGKYDEAFSAYKAALNLYKELGDLDGQNWVFGTMKNLSLTLNDYESAYGYQNKEFEIYKQMNDTLKKKEQIKMQEFYHNRELKIINEKQLLMLKAEEEKRKRITTIASALLLLVLGGGTAVYVITKQRNQLKKANQIITQQNIDLEQSNEEIRAINDELHDKNEALELANQEIRQQKAVVEKFFEELKKTNIELDDKNKKLGKAYDDIKASINYASKIQNYILYDDEHLQENFPDSFIFYKPKDLVSGDFYLSSDICLSGNIGSSKKMLIVADCTGHGVPAAFLTIFTNDSIKQILPQVQQPSDIISALDTTFSKDDSKTTEHDFYKSFEEAKRDSVDIACIFYDKKTKMLEYSVSSRPIIVVRNGEIHKLDAEFHAGVGSKYYKSPKFTGYKTYSFQLLPGDNVFLFSDGMSDQFTEITGKPLGSKKFKVMLQSLAKLPKEEKNKYLKDFYKTVRGKEIQTDDMLMVGFEVKEDEDDSGVDIGNDEMEKENV